MKAKMTPKWLARIRERDSASAKAAMLFKLSEQGRMARQLMLDNWTCSAGYDHAMAPCPVHQPWYGR